MARAGRVRRGGGAETPRTVRFRMPGIYPVLGKHRVNPGMEIRDISDRQEWQRHADAALAPLPQRWAYGAAMTAMGASVRRFAISDGGAPVGFVQLLTRPICGFRISLATQGPIWTKAPPIEARAAALRLLRRSVPGRLLLTAERSDAALGRAGFVPVMTAGTMARLALDDGVRARMHGKWRNRLVKAERRGLEVGALRRTRLDWLLDADDAAQKAKGYRALPRAFVQNWPDPVLSLAMIQKGEPIAAMLFLRHGTTATYHIGWSGEDGRRVAAHNLLLWRAMEALRKDGARYLDLGALDTVNAPGLARFKLGSGAVPVKTGGTWLGW